MEYINPWPLLRGEKGQREEGIRLAQQAYSKQPDSPPHIMQMGIALLWLEKYGEAWTHFRSKIESNPSMSGDGDYGMSGVAKWCVGKPEEAVLEWRAGSKAKYARASGLGIRMPLLLFFVSILEPNLFGRKLAEKLLREKTGDTRIKNWPAPIAKFVLDQIGESEFQAVCRARNPQESSNRQWLADFYRSLMKYEPSNHSAFKEAMHKVSDTSQPEWQEQNIFLTRIWSEEFFLARYEAQRQRGESGYGGLRV